MREITAKTLQKNTHKRFRKLAKKVGSKTNAILLLERNSDLSKSWLEKFWTGEADNPYVSNLDALQKALDSVMPEGK